MGKGKAMMNDLDKQNERERSKEWFFARAQHVNLTGYDKLVRMYNQAYADDTTSRPRTVFYLRTEPKTHLILTVADSKPLLQWQVEITLRFPAAGEYIYLGAIDYEGVLRPSNPLRTQEPELKQLIWSIIKRLRGDTPEDVILRLGRESGICALCNRELTDAVSIARGVGSVCAKRYGIPLQPALDLEAF